ncbi:MAG: AMP-binding protein [Beijerinckiaceae bacterium]
MRQLTRTLFDQLAAHAAFTPGKPAIMLPDRIVTYEILVNGVYSVQRTISHLMLDRNHPVAIAVDNPGRHLIVLLALIRSGYTVTSIRADQLGLAISFGAKAVLTDRLIPPQAGARVHAVDDKWFQGGTVARPPAHDFPADRIARIILTSGSTGVPKAIGVSFATMHSRIFGAYLSGIASEHRYFTTYGLSGSLFSYAMRVLCSGNTIILAPADKALHTAMTYGATAIRASASQARGLLELQAQRKVPLRLAQFTTGGGPMSVELCDEIQRVFGAEVINTYNSTEGGFMGLAAGELLKRRREKGNCFIPLVRVEIVDDADVPLPIGHEGRIRIQSDIMAWEFKGSLMETDEVRQNKWFYPGDVGLLDPEGLLIVTGRADELINSGGGKFTPEIIEEAISRNPSLSGAAVVRMPNHEPWLATTSREAGSLDAVNDWIADNLPGELGGVQIARMFTVAEIPRTQSGKIARGELRRLLLALSADGA